MSEGRVRFHVWSRDSWPREWTASELRDAVYSSYLALRNGKLKRPPPPHTVMEIADYLECNLEERNRLLLAARYAPVPPFLSGDMLQCVVNTMREVTEYLPLPSYVINRDWNILYLNQYVLKLFGFSQEDLTKATPDRLNVLHLIFDPELPMYQFLAHDPDAWEHIARRNIYGFKLENALSQYEDWFEPHVAKLMKLPRFAELWEQVQTDGYADIEAAFLYYDIEILISNGKAVRVRPILTSLGNYGYPLIVSYIPVDQASRAAFTELGIPTPDNGWGTCPHSLN